MLTELCQEECCSTLWEQGELSTFGTFTSAHSVLTLRLSAQDRDNQAAPAPVPP